MSFEREKLSVAVGQRIRKLRVERRLSQEELALVSELTPAYLGRVERGEKCPSVETVFKISKGLGVPLYELLDLSDEGTPAKKTALGRIGSVIEGLSDDAALKLADIVCEMSEFKEK